MRRQRGTTGGGTGVHDTVVNQMLSKIDGVESLNNVLIIGTSVLCWRMNECLSLSRKFYVCTVAGMTNRKDMIDEALLRPGRLEVTAGRSHTHDSFLLPISYILILQHGTPPSDRPSILCERLSIV